MSHCFTNESGKVSKRLLRPGEVAELFKVNPKTVKRWVQANKLKAIQTPGGHSRFEFDYIMDMIKNSPKVLLFIFFLL
jgi:excisionase family DNA binding protein